MRIPLGGPRSGGTVPVCCVMAQCVVAAELRCCVTRLQTPRVPIPAQLGMRAAACLPPLIPIPVSLSLATRPHPCHLTVGHPSPSNHPQPYGHVPLDSGPPRLPAQGSSSPARRPNIAQFFKRGPISFTNEGPMVPGRICSGPAHWPGRIVLPPPPQEPIVPGPSGAAPGGLMGAGVPPAGAPAAQLAAAQGLGPADL